MNFIHLRDETGRLLATIAYVKALPNKVYYGATVVSPKEPRNAVSLAKGRQIATARCDGASDHCFGMYEGSDWRPRMVSRHRDDSRRNNIVNKLEHHGIKVCGVLDEQTFAEPENGRTNLTAGEHDR